VICAIHSTDEDDREDYGLVHCELAGDSSCRFVTSFFCAFSVVIALACGLAFYGMRGITTSAISLCGSTTDH